MLLEIDPTELEGLAANVLATQKHCDKALRSTLVKAGRWLRAQTLKGLSAQLKVQQKVIKHRLRAAAKVKNTPHGPRVTIWYGLDPVALIYLGAKQNSEGVSASGGRTIAGAFISRARSGSLQVFKRRDKARLPLDKQTAEIAIGSTHYLEHEINSRLFEAFFYKTFEHELTWRMLQE